MAKNCLLTTLKAVVSNNMLCTFDEVRIKLQPGEHFKGYMWQYPGNTATISLVSGSANVSSPSGATLPMTVIQASTLYDIVAGDGGAILSITHIDQLYEPDPILFHIPTSLFDLQTKYRGVSRITNSSISIPDSKLYGDLADLKDTFNIDLFNIRAGGVYGDIRYLGRLPIFREFQNSVSTKIEGDFINVAKIARGKGRTTGSKYIIVEKNCNVKFNGNDIPVVSTYYKGGTLSWTASTITFNGEEIQNSDVIIE